MRALMQPCIDSAPSHGSLIQLVPAAVVQTSNSYYSLFPSSFFFLIHLFLLSLSHCLRLFLPHRLFPSSTPLYSSYSSSPSLIPPSSSTSSSSPHQLLILHRDGGSNTQLKNSIPDHSSKLNRGPFDAKSDFKNEAGRKFHYILTEQKRGL